MINKLINKDLLKEIRSIAIWAAVMDIILVAASLFFISWFCALTGALLGTVLLVLDMFFLSLSVQSVANGARRGKDGTAKMIALYILRLTFLTFGLYFAVISPSINIVCAAIPLFYPKLIYFLKAVITKKEG